MVLDNPTGAENKMVYELNVGNISQGSPGTGLWLIRALQTADFGEGPGVNGLEWRSL